MPTYSFKCPACSHPFDRTLSMSARDTAQACPLCQTIATKIIPEEIGTVLRGDAWVGKNVRLREQMARRRASVGMREEAFLREGPQCKLVPNVDGEEVDSWKEATKLAASVGKDTTLYKRKAQEKA
jgi:putative FmdB family regulatory protein